MSFVWYGEDNPETCGWAWWFEAWYNMIYLEYFGLWDYTGEPKRPEVTRGGTGAGFGPLSYVQTSPLVGVVGENLVRNSG